ncbi:hypothetical protein LWI29_038515 [Acer saccharum]|uniref:Uncharacterized protein n=1 Tax=Acer saccharum TaxID=4024 RepID=A0AA39RN25_ACESA|nr:hypothetical protein LWI29_038515 [Acer saccharum]
MENPVKQLISDDPDGSSKALLGESTSLGLNNQSKISSLNRDTNCKTSKRVWRTKIWAANFGNFGEKLAPAKGKRSGDVSVNGEESVQKKHKEILVSEGSAIVDQRLEKRCGDASDVIKCGWSVVELVWCVFGTGATAIGAKEGSKDCGCTALARVEDGGV